MSKATLADLATMTLAELATLSGATTIDIQSWLNRQKLTTRYAKTQQGKAQKFNRENAAELCLIARLVRAGISPAEAARMVGELFKFREPWLPHGWVVFLPNNKKLPFMDFDDAPTAKELDVLDENECVYVLVNVGRLADKVAAHFEPDEEDVTR
jgi:hypothetical protein